MRNCSWEQKKTLAFTWRTFKEFVQSLFKYFQNSTLTSISCSRLVNNSNLYTSKEKSISQPWLSFRLYWINEHNLHSDKSILAETYLLIPTLDESFNSLSLLSSSSSFSFFLVQIKVKTLEAERKIITGIKLNFHRLEDDLETHFERIYF